METIQIDNLVVKVKDFGQVEHGDIFRITKNWEDGWRLPNKDELDLIYDYKVKYGQFEDKYFWSSNEYIEREYSIGICAWVKHFGNGLNFGFGPLHPAYLISVKSKNDKEFFKDGILELRFCNNIELLRYDFGLVDWQMVGNIVKELGGDWRVPTLNELKIIKPFKLQIGGIGKDYYWGVTIQDGVECSASADFSDNSRFAEKQNLKNNLFLVRSEKPWRFEIPEGMVII